MHAKLGVTFTKRKPWEREAASERAIEDERATESTNLRAIEDSERATENLNQRISESCKSESENLNSERARVRT